MDRRQFLCLALSIPAIDVLSKPALATTWTEKDFTCPVCATRNTFRVIMSYGTYIYQWPSKYQLIYWPVIDSNSVYCCKKCFVSVFMWDYEQLPKDKIPEITRQLAGVRIGSAFTDYAKVPMSERLEIAEKIYEVLNKKTEFWCWFYRILGYHYSNEKKIDRAAQARKKALELAQKMLNDKDPEISAKELLVISAAMKHFLKDDNGAVSDLNQALKTDYFNKSLDAEKNKNGEQNLNALIDDYLGRIRSAKPPRDDSQ